MARESEEEDSRCKLENRACNDLVLWAGEGEKGERWEGSRGLKRAVVGNIIYISPLN